MIYFRYLILLISVIYTHSYINNYIQTSNNLKTNDLSKTYYKEEFPKKVEEYFQEQSLKKKLYNIHEEATPKKADNNFEDDFLKINLQNNYEEEIPKKIEKYFQEQSLNRHIIYWFD